MKRCISTLLLMALCCQSTAAETVSIPWPDFQRLYEAHIKKRLLDAMPEAAKPQRFVIETAEYRLRISPTGASGTITLAGQHLGGSPESIPLFGPDLILMDVQEISGGTLIDAGSSHPIGLLPTEGETFKIKLSVMVPAKRDRQSRILHISGPKALSRQMHLTHDDAIAILQAPGIQDDAGAYRLAAADSLSIRFTERSKTLRVADRIQIDMATILTVGDKEIFGTTYLQFGSTQTTKPLTFTLPAEARWLDADLPCSPIAADKSQFEITQPEDASAGAYAVQWAIDIDSAAAFLLPRITANKGSQGRFIVRSPSYVKTNVSGEGLIKDIPAAPSATEHATAFGIESTYNRIAPEKPLSLTIERFKAVNMPQTVLDEVQLHVAFDDNGGILSRLRISVPASEKTLRLKTIEKATIWSLTVNGAKASPYVGPDGDWVIPLSKSRASEVELTFLRQGPKLGLHGKVEALVPATGLPTKRLIVLATLPKRLDVISMEGPVTAANKHCRQPDLDGSDDAYAFSRDYHDGDAVNVALFYKEPVNEEH